MYKLLHDEVTNSRGRWGQAIETRYQTFKCEHCGGYCVAVHGAPPPKKCGKCKL